MNVRNKHEGFKCTYAVAGVLLIARLGTCVNARRDLFQLYEM